MSTTTNTGHPLMSASGDRIRIRAVLEHLGTGAELRDFSAPGSEKLALVRTAAQRKLIVWHKGRNRYELTAAGWCELAPSRRFGLGSMLLGTAAGATIGALALGVFWVAAGASHIPAPRPAVASSPASPRVASLSAPAVNGALASPAPLAVNSPVAVEAAAPAAPAPAPAAPVAVPAREAAPAPLAEPTTVAEQTLPEQLAEAAAKAKQAAAAKKARQKAAARRRREDAARAWAATEPSRGYGGYSGGGPSSWFAYR